jgi:hypothetical protein
LLFKLSIVLRIKFRGINQPPRLAAKRYVQFVLLKFSPTRSK